MANHGAAALLLITTVLMAVALSGADARPTGYVLDVAPVQELACNKVHGVQAGETCFSIGQGAGLGQDDFLSFNPNINCDSIFVGQWVCLQAQGA